MFVCILYSLPIINLKHSFYSIWHKILWIPFPLPLLIQMQNQIISHRNHLKFLFSTFKCVSVISFRASIALFFSKNNNNRNTHTFTGNSPVLAKFPNWNLLSSIYWVSHRRNLVTILLWKISASLLQYFMCQKGILTKLELIQKIVQFSFSTLIPMRSMFVIRARTKFQCHVHIYAYAKLQQ